MTLSREWIKKEKLLTQENFLKSIFLNLAKKYSANYSEKIL